MQKSPNLPQNASLIIRDRECVKKLNCELSWGKKEKNVEQKKQVNFKNRQR